MTHKTVFWNSETGQQEERDCTPEEIAEIEARQAAAIAAAQAKIQQDIADYKEWARLERDKMLNRIAGIGVTALTDGDTTLATAVKNTKMALLDITTAPGVVAATTKAEVQAAIVAAHAAIVAAAPAVIRKALTGVAD